MKYELIKSSTDPGHWHVEAFTEEGECVKAVFSGPEAKDRAEMYMMRQVTLETPILSRHYTKLNGREVIG